MARWWRRRKSEAGDQAGYQAAREQFQAHALPFPFIPEEMRADLGRLEEWVFATNHDGQGLLDADVFVAEAEAAPPPDFVLLGQAGHGIQSYAMHYYLARRPLCLFLQIAYGGAYTDNEAAVASMERRFGLAERLIKAMPAAVDAGRLGPAERWVIGDSDFHGVSWHRVNCLDPLDDGRQALDEEQEVLAQALASLEG